MDFQTTFFCWCRGEVSAGSPIRHSHPPASGTDSDEEGKNNIAFFSRIIIIIIMTTN